jgi:endonuclease/exonuclease/phosphatase family metal-dependent hydrolase
LWRHRLFDLKRPGTVPIRPLLRSARHLLLIGTAALAVAALFPFQLGSAFGRPAVGDGCADARPFWLESAAPAGTGAPLPMPPLRVVSYNLRSGLGPGGLPFAGREQVEANLRRIAAQSAAERPDVVGLNEIDFGSRRSGWLDQPRFMAQELERLTGEPYRVVGGETWRRDLPGFEVRFGNALLVRHPLVESRACLLGRDCGLPAVSAGGLLSRVVGEARGLIHARIDFHGREVDLLLTHLEAFVLEQREAQASEILKRFLSPGRPTLLLGDINAVPSAMTARRRHFAADRTHDILTSGPLIDARVLVAARRSGADLAPWATYPAEAPRWPLDAILATAHFSPRELAVIGGTASDHRGLSGLFQWVDGEGVAELEQWHAGNRQRQLARILACDLEGAPAGERPQRLQRLIDATGFEGMDGLPVPRPGNRPPDDPQSGEHRIDRSG